MRLFLAVAVGCGVLAPSLAGAEQTFPYKAFITSNDVYVRSGPGQSYYPTDKLRAGQQIEVFRHDPGGWYAIRPPQGSFSWVSGRHLQWSSPTPEIPGLATIRGERVASRAGSQFSSIRDVIQVRLHDREPVEVLEQKRTGGGSGGNVWYKIAPPSGEFRWVFGRYVDPDFADKGLRKTHAAEKRVSATAAEPATLAAAEEEEEAAEGAFAGDQRRIETAGVDSVERLAPAQVVPAYYRQAAPAERPSVDTVRLPAERSWRRPVVEEPAEESLAPRALSPEQFQAELEAIDLTLSIMVTEEPTVWVFDEMRQQAESLLVQAETALERGRARVLVKKLTRFEDLKRRHDAIYSVRQQTERSNRPLAELSRSNRTADAGRSRLGEGDFDGVGELTRVVSPKLGAPRYALVDRGGGVRAYVSPAPGVNLRHYVGRRVGLNGTRGYIPELRARHIMAQHVRVVDDRDVSRR